MDDLMKHLKMPETSIKQEPTEQPDAASQADAFLDTARHLLSPANVASANTQAHSKPANYMPSAADALNDTHQQAPSLSEVNANGVHPARVALLDSRRDEEGQPGASGNGSRFFSKGANAEPLGAARPTPHHPGAAVGADGMEGIVPSNPFSDPPRGPAGFVPPVKAQDGGITSTDPYARNVMMLNNMAAQKGHRVKYDIYRKKNTNLYYGTVHLGPHKFSIHHPQATAVTSSREAKLKLAKLGLERLKELARGDIKFNPSVPSQPPQGYERVVVPTSQASGPVPSRDAAVRPTSSNPMPHDGHHGNLVYRPRLSETQAGNSYQLSDLVPRHPASRPAPHSKALLSQTGNSRTLSSLVPKHSSVYPSHHRIKKERRTRTHFGAGRDQAHPPANIDQATHTASQSKIEQVLGRTNMSPDGNWVSLLHEWICARSGSMGVNKPEFKISREPPAEGKSADDLGWTAFVTIPEFYPRTFGSGRKYLPSEKVARQMAAKKAVEWLIEEGYITDVDRDGHIRKRKASPGGRSPSVLQSQGRPAKRLQIGPTTPGGTAAPGGSRLQEQDERERDGSRDRRERGRDRSRDDKDRAREHDMYHRDYESYSGRHRDRSRDKSRDRSRERSRRDRRDRDRSHDRDHDRHRRDRDREKSRERHRADKERESTRHRVETQSSSHPIAAGQTFAGPSIPNGSLLKVELGSNGTTSGSTGDDYEAKVAALAPLLGFNQPKVYFMPSDPVRWPKSIFNGSVHFPGYTVDGTDGAAVIQIKDEPIAGADAAKQLLYKRALAWLDKQQDDREKTLEQQLKQLRELRARKTEPMEEGEL